MPRFEGRSSLRSWLYREITAFIVRSTDATDSDFFRRWPAQPTDPARVADIFERFGLPDRARS